MGDSAYSSSLSRTSIRTSTSKKSKGGLVASAKKSLGKIPARNHGRFGIVAAGPVTSFLLEVAALEVVRRFSKARCPFVWVGLQALQVVCYPPFKWIHRWSPFGALVKSMQAFSGPFLVLSLATAFSDHSGNKDVHLDDSQDSPGISNSNAVSESDSHLPTVQSTPSMSVGDEGPESLSSKSWLLQLYNELENQGISLPERMDKQELHRFYAAANGDFSSFMSSVKKTILWRETYRILSEQELEMWSNLVFWHGFDVKHRPCLIVRLGLACMTLPLSDRSHFAQAVVSQVEHGVLHLADNEHPQITVLVDCEGLSPLRIPMQILRSCSSHLQDHFPKRLGFVFVIRLPPVARVVAQTFIQFLKPGTRKKLKIVGKMYERALSEFVQMLPTYLGGVCTCMRCANHNMCKGQQPCITGNNLIESGPDVVRDENQPLHDPSREADMLENANLEQALRTAVVGILIFWVLIAFVAGIYDPESWLVLLPGGKT